jgi:hypothetical protein
VIATGVMRILQKMMLKEENAILGGNNSVALGVPVTPTLSASGTGGTLPTLTYDVAVVALTYEGYRAWVGAGILAGHPSADVARSSPARTARRTPSTAASSNKSTVATQAVTLGQNLFASTHGHQRRGCVRLVRRRRRCGTARSR